MGGGLGSRPQGFLDISSALLGYSVHELRNERSFDKPRHLAFVLFPAVVCFSSKGHQGVRDAVCSIPES